MSIVFDIIFYVKLPKKANQWIDQWNIICSLFTIFGSYIIILADISI